MLLKASKPLSLECFFYSASIRAVTPQTSLGCKTENLSLPDLCSRVSDTRRNPKKARCAAKVGGTTVTFFFLRQDQICDANSKTCILLHANLAPSIPSWKSFLFARKWTNRPRNSLEKLKNRSYSPVCICLCQASPGPLDCHVIVNHSQESEHLVSAAGRWK